MTGDDDLRIRIGRVRSRGGLHTRPFIINRSISNCTFFLTLGIGHDSSAA